MHLCTGISIFTAETERIRMDDTEYIKAVRQGEPEKFRFLVEKYRTTVFRTAMGFVHCPAEAEDLTQEIFICVYRSLNTFREDSAFSTWLYRITLNTCISYTRKMKRHRLLRLTGQLFREVLQLPDPSASPAEQIIQTQTATSIRRALDSLPEKQHTAFVLSKYDELPQKEIARIMGITEGAVEQLLQRAKINLQKKLQQP